MTIDRLAALRDEYAALSLPLGSAREFAKHERDTALWYMEQMVAAAGVTVAPQSLDAERVAAFLHDEYGCRVTCRGGRLADDRHPSHNEAYRGQAERLIAATGRVTGDALVLDGPCDDQCRHD